MERLARFVSSAGCTWVDQSYCRSRGLRNVIQVSSLPHYPRITVDVTFHMNIIPSQSDQTLTIAQ